MNNRVVIVAIVALVILIFIALAIGGEVVEPSPTPTNPPTHPPSPTLTETWTATSTRSFTATKTETSSPTPTATPSSSSTATAALTDTATSTMPPLPVLGANKQTQDPLIIQLPSGVILRVSPDCNGTFRVIGEGNDLLIECIEFTPTPEPTPTDTPSPTPTSTDTPTPTNTPAPTETPTNTPTNTATPTRLPTITPPPSLTPTPTLVQPIGQTGWSKLTFEDNFDGTAINRNKWWTCNWGTYGDCRTFIRDAKEIYLARNVVVRDGILHLIAKRENYTAAWGTTYQYTSGTVTTAYNKHMQPWGYWEARIKIPKGQGAFPAWWILKRYEDGAPRQEMDIMESLGNDPSRVFQSFHYPEGGSFAAKSDDWTKEYHVYGALLEPGRARWYIDGVLVRDYVNPNIVPSNMYMLLNLAVGTAWNGNFADNSWNQIEMLVDYVRVWTR